MGESPTLPPLANPDLLADFVARLTDAEVIRYNSALRYWWRGGAARPEQLTPKGQWSNWLIQAGRGWGKNRTASEAIKEYVDDHPYSRIALVAPTMDDCRKVVVEGESGLLSVYPTNERPDYESSKRTITFKNGAQAFLYSAEEPERLRGPQHHAAYCDEIALYKEFDTLWSNLKMGCRLGDDPRVIATTTPKPLPFLRALNADAETVVTRGTTWDNRANLAPPALRELERLYSGTRVGRQELEGELLEDAEGALWRRSQIDACRLKKAPELVRIVVAVDPAVTANEGSDECGIAACGIDADEHGHVLQDASCKLPPDQWAQKVVDVFDFWKADKIIAEVNQGGDLVETTLRTVRKNLPYQSVHASRGKTARAEPISALYEQGKVHHCGSFPALEDEMTTWVPGKLTRSPNRAEAVVWGLSFLMLKVFHKGRALWA